MTYDLIFLRFSIRGHTGADKTCLNKFCSITVLNFCLVSNFFPYVVRSQVKVSVIYLIYCGANYFLSY